MDHTLLVLLLCFWSSGVHGGEIHSLQESFRLVGESSRCEGYLELKLEEWRRVTIEDFQRDWRIATFICRKLDCGSAIYFYMYSKISSNAWEMSSECILSGSALKDCAKAKDSGQHISITCSDSVRLVNGSSLCSGRLEVKLPQSDHSWSSVCNADFNKEAAEVVCREIDCGSPSVLQGALYGEVEAPTWTSQFHCKGNEESLLGCRRSDSARNTCSPGKAVGLTCSEPLRLVGGDTQCDGKLESRFDRNWKPVVGSDLTQEERDILCKWLGCGSAVSSEIHQESFDEDMWRIPPECFQPGSAIRECELEYDLLDESLRLNCSEQTVEPDRTTEGNLPPKEPTAEPDRTTEGNLHLRVFTPVFIFCLVLMVLSVTFFISAVWFTYKPTRGQKSEQEKDRELKTQQQSLNSPDGDV